MIDRLLEVAEVPGGGEVVDVGAGTGLFAELLAARGHRVWALEPNAAMRAGAKKRDAITWSDGSFEDTQLEDRCADWIVAAQAFHWADPTRALAEMDRIRKPGRWFTVLWNNRHVEASPLLAYARERILAMVPDFDEGYRDRNWASVLTSTGHFTEVREHEVIHEVSMTPVRFCDLWRSHNLLNAAAGPAGIEALLADLQRYMHECGLDESFGVPYRCRAYSAR